MNRTLLGDFINNRQTDRQKLTLNLKCYLEIEFINQPTCHHATALSPIRLFFLLYSVCLFFFLNMPSPFSSPKLHWRWSLQLLYLPLHQTPFLNQVPLLRCLLILSFHLYLDWVCLQPHLQPRLQPHFQPRLQRHRPQGQVCQKGVISILGCFFAPGDFERFYILKMRSWTMK